MVGVAFASRVGILLQVASIRIGFMIVHMQIDVTVWASLRYDDTPSRTHPHSLPSLDTSYTHTYRDLCTTLQGIEDQNRRHEQQLRDKLTSPHEFHLSPPIKRWYYFFLGGIPFALSNQALPKANELPTSNIVSPAPSTVSATPRTVGSAMRCVAALSFMRVIEMK